MTAPDQTNPVLNAILAQLDGASHVLDVGCGDGVLARALGRRGFHVTGIDPQAESGRRNHTMSFVAVSN